MTKRAARAEPGPALLLAPEIAPAGHRLPRGRWGWCLGEKAFRAVRVVAFDRLSPNGWERVRRGLQSRSDPALSTRRSTPVRPELVEGPRQSRTPFGLRYRRPSPNWLGIVRREDVSDAKNKRRPAKAG